MPVRLRALSFSTMLCKAALAAPLVLFAHEARAEPTGGVVALGSASIAQAGNITTITQGTDRAVLDWQSFNLNSAETARFIQPNTGSVTVNRVHDVSASTIAGTLEANGHVIITNPNGVMFTNTARVDVGALTVSTASVNDTDAAAFVSGTRNDLALTVAGNANAKISNAGTITAKDAGLVGLVAPNVENSGIIRANKGRVTLASGDTATLDLYGDGLVSLAVSKSTEQRLVANAGLVQADGGTVLLTAASAADVANALITVEGAVQANTVNQQQGKIILSATKGSIQVTGDVRANGDSTQRGGSITANGQFVALGGNITANGSHGGTINAHATKTLSLADRISANGSHGNGGTITLRSDDATWETNSSTISADGWLNGGNILHTAENQIISSGHYSANGLTGNGGTIDITAGAAKFLSASLTATGAVDGGRIRLGGEYQGGKNLGLDANGVAIDELKNAKYLVLDSGTKVNVSSTGNNGKGGTAILWSEITTLALGAIQAIPGLLTGAGGLVEISSAGELQYNATVQTGLGSRAGTVLLDPKNIIIANSSYSPTAMIMGYGYGLNSPNITVPGLTDAESMGMSVALSGTQMALGYYTLDSYDKTIGNTGAVYLYTFTDNAFNGGSLQGIVGKGYTGGKNIDVANLGASDQFGFSISLDANRLAIGALADDGLGNPRSDSGAVYLFTFADAAFSGGSLASTIGYGYNGSKDLDLSSYIYSGDAFGRAVSLNGNNLAVGANGDDGATDAVSNTGAVYLISFTDSDFNGAALKGIMGSGYTGPNNYDISLDASDQFGYSLSLSGTRLAIGAYTDDGVTNANLTAGAVYVFSFADTQFTAPTLHSIIGSGYTGGNNVDVVLDASDQFGRSVSLDGDMLAIGANTEDGITNGNNSAGAVYLYTLDPTLSAAPTLQAIIGSGYTGGKNYNQSLGSSDTFGTSVSLNNNRLAITAFGDDGLSDFATDAGAVYLYSFTDAFFSGTVLEGRVGSGYVGAKNINTGLAGSSLLGTAISMNNNRLALSVLSDTGFDNSKIKAGAVYLYSFTDDNFSGSALEGIIGYGYTGGKNYNVTTLESGDQFGYALSLNNNHLAVGARWDDGYANARTNSGAVYLFNFADDQFNTPTLEATIGHGYTTAQSAKNYNLTLDSNDYFGSAVSLDGNMLAIGAVQDAGSGNSKSASGAVYLFTFTSDFTSLTRQATIGNGYTGGKNYNLALDTSDNFGVSVSLNNNRLAVGAIGDDGVANTISGSGAVHLFTFADNLFSSAQKVGTIGYGYTGTGNIDLSETLHAGDNLGRSVALEGTTLAAGSPPDDGLGTTATNNNYGAVYLFAFNDEALTSGRTDGMIGVGYTGGKNISFGGSNTNGTNNLGGGDLFGASISFDNGQLAIGASGDDGYGNYATDAGAVYLVHSNASTNVAGGGAFATSSTTTLGLTPDSIAQLLSTPQNVILQASNDISLLDNLTVNNISGNGGTLTLQAGRSIILNALLTSDNGDVNLLANEKSATGVITANRTSGAAVITFGANGAINAGTGTVTIRLDDGAGRTGTQAASGDITLGNITAGNLLVTSAYQYGNLILNGILTASGAGNAITLAPGGSFTNNAGVSALQLTGGGRWLLYSDHNVLNSLGGITAQEQYNCAYGSCTVPASGNALLYQYGNNLLRIGVNATRQYGDVNPTTAELQAMLLVSGYINGESWTDIDVKPTWSIAGTATATAAADTTHAITFSGGSDATYSLYYDSSLLTIAKKDITATWNAPLTKTYGDVNPAVGNGNFTFTGLANGELGTVITATGDFGTITNLTGAGAYDVGALFTATNYNITNAPITTLTIAKKDITASWTGALTKTYGDANPTVSNSNFTFTGLINGDLASAITASGNFGALDASSNAGTYTNGVGGIFSAANYNITNTPLTTLTINNRTLTAALSGTTSKTYDGLTTAALTSGNYSLSNIYGGDDVTLSSFLNGTYANKNAGSGKTVSVTGLSLSGTKASNYQLSSTSINAAIGTILQKALTISGISGVGKTYDGLLTASLTGTGSLNGTIGGDTVTLNSASAAATYADKNAGTNKAVTATGYALAGADAANYTISQPTGLTATIVQKALTISGISAVGKTYDGLLTASLTGTGSLTGTIGGDTVTLNSASAAATYADKNAGTNKAVTATGYALAGADATNYTISQPTGLTATILQKALTISGISAVGKTYDGLLTASLTGTGSLNGTIGGDTVTLNSASAAATYADKNAGTNKAVTATGYALAGADATNYTISQPTGLTASITPANLIVSAVGGLSKIYGDSDPGFSYTYTGLVGGDANASFTGAVARNAGENAGLYTIGQNTLAATGNYQIGSFNTADFNITKRAITGVVQDASRMYGDANPTLNGSNVTWSNMAFGETGAVIDSVGFNFNGATTGNNAGSSYTISLASFTDNNYTLAGSTNGQLDVTQANLQIRANDISSFTGQPFPTLTASYIGLKNGDAVSVISGLQLASAATMDTVGSFAITASGASATNYTISYLPGTLTLKAPVSATATVVPDTVQQGRINNSLQTQIGQMMEPTLFVAQNSPTMMSTKTQNESTNTRETKGSTSNSVYTQNSASSLPLGLVFLSPELQKQLQ